MNHYRYILTKGDNSSNSFRELCKILGIDQTGTSPYHQSLSKSKRDWDKKVTFVMLANRSSIRESTRESP